MAEAFAGWRAPGVFHPRTPEDICGQKMKGARHG